MLKQRDEWIEYGYDSFTCEQQKALKEIKVKIEELIGKPISEFLTSINNVLDSREIVTQVGENSNNPMAKYVSRVMNAGGVFVSVEIIYVLILMACTFVNTPEESSKIDKLLVKFDEVMDNVYKTREKMKNDKAKNT